MFTTWNIWLSVKKQSLGSNGIGYSQFALTGLLLVPVQSLFTHVPAMLTSNIMRIHFNFLHFIVYSIFGDSKRFDLYQ